MKGKENEDKGYKRKNFERGVLRTGRSKRRKRFGDKIKKLFEEKQEKESVRGDGKKSFERGVSGGRLARCEEENVKNRWKKSRKRRVR